MAAVEAIAVTEIVLAAAREVVLAREVAVDTEETLAIEIVLAVAREAVADTEEALAVALMTEAEVVQETKGVFCANLGKR